MRRALLMFALAACGDALPGAPDAPPPPDASATDLVHVRYSGTAGASLSGRRVYFLQPSGTLASVTVTDSAGLANARLPDGGTIVLIDGPVLSVYVGVRGGEEILVGNPVSELVATPEYLDLHLTLDRQDPIDRYMLHASCDIDPNGGVLFSGQGLNQIEVTAALTGPVDYSSLLDCDANHRQDLLFTAVDDFGTPVGYQYYPAVTFAGPTGTQARRDLHVGDGYLPVSSHLSVHNVPAALQQLTVSQTLWSKHFLMSSSEFASEFAATMDGSADVTFPLPTPSTATMVTRVAGSDFDSSVLGVQHVIQWAPATAETTVDFGSEMLAPRLTRPSTDFSTASISWNDQPTLPEDPTRPNTVLITVNVSGDRGITLVQMVGPYTADESGAVTFPVPRVSEALDAVFVDAFNRPSVTKLRLDDADARRQLLATQLQLFSFDTASGRIVYETASQSVFE